MGVEMNIEGKKVLIVGTGKSGIAAAALLSQVGAVPVLFDENESTDKGEVEKKLPEGVRAEVITGKLPDQAADEAQLLVLSPWCPGGYAFCGEVQGQGCACLG